MKLKIVLFAVLLNFISASKVKFNLMFLKRSSVFFILIYMCAFNLSFEHNMQKPRCENISTFNVIDFLSILCIMYNHMSLSIIKRLSPGGNECDRSTF